MSVSYAIKELLTGFLASDKPLPRKVASRRGRHLAGAFEFLEQRTLFSAGLLPISPGFPSTSFDYNAAVNYDASTLNFSATGVPTSVYLSSASSGITITGNPNLQLNFLVDHSGNLAGHANPGPDFVVTGSVTINSQTYSGTLVTGNAVAFGFLPANGGGTTDEYNLEIGSVGGALAPLFGGSDLGLVIFSGNSTFTGSFSANFAGQAEGSFGPLPTIAGRVYWDQNNNGIDDGGAEQGINGASVTLAGTDVNGNPVSLTTTTSTINGVIGSFDFLNIPVSDLTGYTITETTPAGYLDRSSDVGNLGGTAGLRNISQIIIPDFGGNQVGTGYEFGNIKPVTVAGNVYEDKNVDAVLDAGDAPIAGVLVTLTDASNNVINTTTTAADGSYNFTTDSSSNPLLAGTYKITETQPAGYLQGANTVGTVNGNPDGSLVPTDMIGSIVLNQGDGGINYNFGEVKPVTIAGTVYADNNTDGVLDAGDTGIGGVLLTLTNTTTNTVVNTTTTAANGSYSFTTTSASNPIPPGTYKVTETQPTGYNQGTNTVGTVNAVTDGSLIPTDMIGAIVLNSGDSGISYNFGEVVPGNGQPPTDVTITKTADKPIINAGTIAGFTVTIKNVGTVTATGVVLTDPLPGGIGGDVNWQIDITTGNPSAFTITGPLNSQVLNLNPAVTTLAGGASLSVHITGLTTFADAPAPTFTGTLPNTATVTASNEPSALQNQKASATITVVAPDVDVTKTADQAEILAGQTAGFTIKIFNEGAATATGVTLTDPLPGGQGHDIKWVIDGSTGNPSAFTITGAIGSQTLSLNPSGISLAAGASLLVHITGVTSSADAGASTCNSGSTCNWLGNLFNWSFGGQSCGTSNYSGGGQICDTSSWCNSGSSGFSFNCGTGGSSGGGGYTGGGNCGGGGNNCTTGTIVNTATVNATNEAPSEQNEKASATITVVACPAQISGFVYNDLNNSGVKQTGEPGIAGVKLTLTGTDSMGDAVTLTTITAADGSYSFTNLLPGTYKVTETQPAGYLQGINAVGTVNGSTDGTLVPTDMIASIVVHSGDSGVNYNFGEVTTNTGSIAGTKYLDLTGNGLSADDTALGGVTIKLYADTNHNGKLDTGDTLVASAVTASGTGAYAFKNLAAGTYFVQECVPNGYVQTGPASGTYTVNLATGQQVANQNFADYKLNCCSSSVCNVYYTIADPGSCRIRTVCDLTGNTRQGDVVTAHFCLYSSATLTLVSYTAPCATADNIQQQKIFDCDTETFGPGSHTLTVTLPSSYYQLDFVCGQAIDHLGTGPNIYYHNQQRFIDGDNGGCNPSCSSSSTLSGFVYNDSHKDGKRSAGDSGICGVTLSLKDACGNVVATCTTKTDGSYCFNLSTPGVYTICEGAVSGYSSGCANVGNVNNCLSGVTCGSSAIGGIVLNGGNCGTNFNFGECK